MQGPLQLERRLRFAAQRIGLAPLLRQVLADAQPQVAIERFEKNADGSYAISGSFSATNVPASKLAKKLKGTTLPQIEGRFDFAALPLKEMPKIGG